MKANKKKIMAKFTETRTCYHCRQKKPVPRILTTMEIYIGIFICNDCKKQRNVKNEFIYEKV